MSANAGMFLTAGATLTSFVTQNQQADAFAAQGVYESRLLEHNADIADMQYHDALTRGQIAAGRQRQATRTLIGSQRAAAAESGLDVGIGTVPDILEESALFGELDATRISNDAAREAFGFKLQASDYRRQSRLRRVAGQNAARGTRAGAISTLLGGIGQVYSQYEESR